MRECVRASGVCAVLTERVEEQDAPAGVVQAGARLDAGRLADVVALGETVVTLEGVARANRWKRRRGQVIGSEAGDTWRGRSSW